MVGLSNRYAIGLIPVRIPRIMAPTLPRPKPLQTRTKVAQRWIQICPVHTRRLISAKISAGEELIVRASHPRRDASSQTRNATSGTTTPSALHRPRGLASVRDVSLRIPGSERAAGSALASEEVAIFTSL